MGVHAEGLEMRSRIQSDTRLKWIEGCGEQMIQYSVSVEAQIHCLQDLANQIFAENRELRAALIKERSKQ